MEIAGVPDPAKAEAIVERCRRLLPLWRAPLHVVGHQVGLRPGRSTVRLEGEEHVEGRAGSFTTTATAARASPCPGAAPPTSSPWSGPRSADSRSGSRGNDSRRRALEAIACGGRT